MKGPQLVVLTIILCFVATMGLAVWVGVRNPAPVDGSEEKEPARSTATVAPEQAGRDAEQAGCKAGDLVRLDAGTVETLLGATAFDLVELESAMAVQDLDKAYQMLGDKRIVRVLQGTRATVVGSLRGRACEVKIEEGAEKGRTAWAPRRWVGSVGHHPPH